MNPYVLVVRNWFGEREITTRHFIEAEDEQMVKYHYHKTFRDTGYHNPSWDDGKHMLAAADHVVDIDAINQVNRRDTSEVLSNHLPEWRKV